MIIRRSRKAEVYWWWLRKCTLQVQLSPWWWTPMIKFYVTIYLTCKKICTKMTFTAWLESAFTYNFSFVVYLGYRNITFFPYRPSLRFQAQVPSTLYVRVYENSIQTYTIGASWNASKCIYTFFYVHLEILKGRGLLVMN